MIGIVATLKIKEGSGSDFEAIAKKTASIANTNDITLTNRTLINYKAMGIIIPVK